MTDPANPSRLPATRPNWALVHPLLAALSQAGIPVHRGDLDQLQNAAALGPEFVHVLAAWIREAHHAPPPAAPALSPASESSVLRQIGPGPSPAAVTGRGPVRRERHAC